MIMTVRDRMANRMFAAMVEAGCEYVVMEVSSQGLKLDRTAGILFDYGVFTNLSPDHIGPAEHESFEEYLYCKSLLFRQCRVGIVNADDPHWEEILKGHTCQVRTFSAEGNDVKDQVVDLFASDIGYINEGGRLGMHFTVSGCMDCKVKVHIPGRFSVYNAMVTMLVCNLAGIPDRAVLDGLEKVQVKGRVEILPVSKDYSMIIDYAHNEMSLRNLLQTLREFKPGRLIVIFGCGGNRSKLRRGRMGETAGMLADFTILTSDNPRWEDPELILYDIENGRQGTEGAYIRIEDRWHMHLTTREREILSFLQEKGMRTIRRSAGYVIRWRIKNL